MRLFLVFVFLSHSLKTVEGTCDVMKALECSGHDLLSQNPLGIMQLKDAENLCGIIGALEVCLKDSLGGCSIIKKVSWVPAIDSAKFICNRLEDYKSASNCYLTKENIKNLEICTQHFLNNIKCGSFETFLNCVVTPIKGCSMKGIEIVNGLFTAFTGFHFQILNCSLPEIRPMKTTSEKSQQTLSTVKPKQQSDMANDTNKSYLHDEVQKPKTATVKNSSSQNAMYAFKVVYYISMVILILS